MRLAVILLSLIAAPAFAQPAGNPVPSNDAYWQSFVGVLQGQCAANVVTIAKQLDETRRQVADLQKQLEELKKK